MSEQTIELGDARLALTCDDDGRFLGLGRIQINGVDLRQPRRPFHIRLDTPEGILYTRLELLRVDRQPTHTDLVLKAVGLPWNRCEFGDDYGQPLYTLRESLDEVSDQLIWRFAPAQQALDNVACSGFSYQFGFHSEARKLHRLLTDGTWEIGGAITGNTVLNQGQCNQPVYAGSRPAQFTTACLKTLDQYGSPQGYSFQFTPRAGLLQGFDFQYHEAGILWQYWPELNGIASLVESPPGSDLLHVVDEYRFPLSAAVWTTPKHVLFAPGARADHLIQDLWLAAYEHVYGMTRERFGVRPTVVVPDLGQAYGTSFDDSQLKVRVQSKHVAPADMLYLLADETLPLLAEQGIRRFFPEVISESDVTQMGARRKLDHGIHGDLHCASVCATHRFFPAEFWGGIKAWRYLANQARQLGVEIGHWFAPHFSPRAPIFQEHPEYRMIDSGGMPAGGGYGFQTIIVADWNTGIYQSVLDDFRRWQDEGGLDFLFVDSYSNMGMLQLNYAAGMRDNYAAFARLLGELQALEIESFTFESVSAFGVSRFGVADPRGDILEQNRAVAGQNDFSWWVGHEHMAYNIGLVVNPRDRTEAQLRESQFRTMANRGYILYQIYDQDHQLPAWWCELNRNYNAALPHMQQRRILPDGKGVCWIDGDTEVLWLFKPHAIDGIVGVDRLDNGAWQGIDVTGPLAAGHVYRLQRVHS